MSFQCFLLPVLDPSVSYLDDTEGVTRMTRIRSTGMTRKHWFHMHLIKKMMSCK